MTADASQARSHLAIVTGASSGIGKAVAIELAQRKIRTILIARRTEHIENLAKELSPLAPSHAVTLNLLDPEAMSPALDKISADHGPVDILVNNAGHSVLRPALEHTLDDHRGIMQVHYFAPVFLINHVLPAMLAQRRGHILNVASMSAKAGAWGHSAYAAAKAAIVSLTQTLAMEYGGQGVHFSYINPGLIDTDFFDNPGYHLLRHQVKKRGIPAQVLAKKIVRLLDRPRLELCVPRIYRILDWFKAISPRFAHWVVKRSSTPK